MHEVNEELEKSHFADLQAIEFDIHTQLLQLKRPHVLQAQHHWETNNVARGHPKHLLLPKLFWYRFFDVGTDEVDIHEFSRAVWIFLRSQADSIASIGLKNQQHLGEVIKMTMDTHDTVGLRQRDSKIEWKEWIAFVMNFGPMMQAFRRARALCSCPSKSLDLASPTDDSSLPGAATCFLFEPSYDRRRTIERLAHEQEPTIIVRLGKGPIPNHIFTISLKLNGKFEHYQVGLALNPSAGGEKLSLLYDGLTFSHFRCWCFSFFVPLFCIDQPRAAVLVFLSHFMFLLLLLLLLLLVVVVMAYVCMCACVYINKQAGVIFGCLNLARPSSPRCLSS